MVGPQLENGFLRIANELVEALYRVNLSAYESRVVLLVIRQTYGYNKKMDRIALSQFAKKTGIERRNVHKVLKRLSSRKIIVVHKDDRGNISYGFQKDYSKWRVSSKQTTGVHRDDKLSSVDTPKLSSTQTPTIYSNKNNSKDTKPLSNKKLKIGKGYIV